MHCCRLDHFGKCPKSARCCVCAGQHEGLKHRCQAKGCEKKSLPCEHHAAKCANCGAGLPLHYTVTKFGQCHCHIACSRVIVIVMSYCNSLSKGWSAWCLEYLGWSIIYKRRMKQRYILEAPAFETFTMFNRDAPKRSSLPGNGPPSS